LKSRDRYHLLTSKRSLWITPLCGLAFVGLAWLVGRFIIVPLFVYWLIVGLMAIVWIGDLINVILLLWRKGG
jgi:ABC-type enterochelin transport system permease subunit